MKKYFLFLLLLLLLFVSCNNNESWFIQEVSFSNGKKVYLKSRSWAIPERNSIILSNHNKKVFLENKDTDFGSFVNIIYEVKNDSLYIYESNTQSDFLIVKESYNNTIINFVEPSTYILLLDSLKIFPKNNNIE